MYFVLRDDFAYSEGVEQLMYVAFLVLFLFLVAALCIGVVLFLRHRALMAGSPLPCNSFGIGEWVYPASTSMARLKEDALQQVRRQRAEDPPHQP